MAQMICFRVSHWVLFQIGSYLHLTYPSPPPTPLLFGARRCSKLIFYFPFLSFRLMHFFKEPWLLWRMVFESPNLGAGLAHCYYLLPASRLSVLTATKYMYMYYPWKQTYLYLLLIYLFISIFKISSCWEVNF